MPDEIIKKPYWKTTIGKTECYESIICIKSWTKPDLKMITDYVSNEDIRKLNWDFVDDDYELFNSNICTKKEAEKFCVYDPNPYEPDKKIKVNYDPNQFLMSFMSEAKKI